MLKLKHLLESVWLRHKHFSKKMYTTGLILFSGVVAVAIVMLGVNGFAGTKQIDHVVAYESEDEENQDDQMTEVLVTVEQSDESQNFDTAAEVNDLQAEIAFLRVEASANITDTETMTMMREEITERYLRTNANNIEDANVQLLGLKDYTALVRIVEAEATGEDLTGKILIANVVMNRVDSKRFPNTVYDVVHQKLNGKAQFSPIDDGRYYTVPITDSTVEAVEKALSGDDYSEGALFFVAKTLASEKAGSWFDNHLDFLFKHGVHSFYKY